MDMNKMTSNFRQFQLKRISSKKKVKMYRAIRAIRYKETEMGDEVIKIVLKSFEHPIILILGTLEAGAVVFDNDLENGLTDTFSFIPKRCRSVDNTVETELTFIFVHPAPNVWVKFTTNHLRNQFLTAYNSMFGLSSGEIQPSGSSTADSGGSTIP